MLAAVGENRRPSVVIQSPSMTTPDAQVAPSTELRTPVTYLRLFSGGSKDLLNKYWHVDEFSLKFFDLTTDNQSVFRAADATEEAEAIAAHFLTLRFNDRIKECAAIRIYSTDLLDLPIRVSSAGEEGGSTGVSAVDARHHDLSGDADSIKCLAGRILHDRDRGGDRIRVLGEHQMACQLLRTKETESNLDRKSTEHYERVMAKYREKNQTWNPSDK
jgi:hypothetical protein